MCYIESIQPVWVSVIFPNWLTNQITENTKMRYVASKKPLSVKRGEEKISVPSEYPQYDSIEEVRGLFGNDDAKLLGYFNSNVAADSAVPSRVYANSADAKDKSVDAVIAKCAELR